MLKPYRQTYTMLLLVIILVSLIGCTNQPSDTIKIGLVLPLTGENAHVGEAGRNAARLALAQSNLSNKVELVYADSKLQPRRAANAARKLISVDNVDALVSFGSGVGNVISPIAKQNGVIHIGTGSDAAIANGSLNFLHWTRPGAQIERLVKEMQRRGLRRIAVMTMNQQGALAQVDALENEIRNTSISVVSKNIFGRDEKDFRTMILKAQKKQPDVYFLIAFSPSLENFAQQYKELGIDKPLTTSEMFDFSVQPHLFNGQWYVSVGSSTSSFKRGYVKRYDQEPTLSSPFIYDDIRLLLNAFHNASTIYSVQQAAERLHSFDNYTGAVGPINIDARGIVHSKPTLKKMVNGSPITLPKEKHGGSETNNTNGRT